MAYTDVISVNEVNDYLGIDDNSRDTEIVRMIKSALKYLEKRTNVIVDPRDVTYILHDGCVRVYDYPINSVTPTGFQREDKGLYSIFTSSGETHLTLNVGDNVVDEDLTEAAFMLIEHYFEEGVRSAIPSSVEHIIAMNKRFIL